MSLTILPNISSISKLDGSNYPTWATYIKAAFRVHNLDHIIDGSKTMPTDIKEALEFTCQSSQAYGFIILSLKESLHHLIDGHMTAKDLWDHLKKQYKKPGSLAAFVTIFSISNTSSHTFSLFSSSTLTNTYTCSQVIGHSHASHSLTSRPTSS
jgi:hypothetical protein